MHERLLRRPQQEDRRSPPPPAGTTKSEAARSSVKRYAKLAQEGRPLSPKKRPGSKPKMDETTRRLLEADMEERPSATLSERREYLGRACGLSVSESTVSRMLRRLGWSRKKRSLGARERDEFLRAAWGLMVAGEVDAERLVFVDLLGAPTFRSLHCMPGLGGRAFGSTPRNWDKNVTLLASITAEGIGPCLAAWRSRVPH